MLILNQILFGLILPAAVAGGVLIFARSRMTETGSGWLIAVALCSGYIAGYLGLEGVPPFPPREGVHYLCYLAGIGLIAGGFWHLSTWGRVLTQAALAIAIPRLLLNSTFKYTWGQLEGILWWAGLAIALFIFWTLVQQSFTALPAGGASPFVYFGLSGGTAVVLAVSGTLRVAQHAGILVAIFAAVWILTLILQRGSEERWRVFPGGASAGIALLLSGLWMNGYFYEEVPAASAVLLAIALPAGPTKRSLFFQIGLIALPVIAAMVIAILRSGLFGESSGY